MQKKAAKFCGLIVITVQEKQCLVVFLELLKIKILKQLPSKETIKNNQMNKNKLLKNKNK